MSWPDRPVTLIIPSLSIVLLCRMRPEKNNDSKAGV